MTVTTQVGTVFTVPLALFVAIAAAAVLTPAWRVLRYPVTAVHEAGHMALALAFGFKVRSITLAFDTSGLTTWSAPARRGKLRRAIVAFAGYPAPAAAAFGLAYLADRTEPRWAAVAVAAGIAIIGLFVRNVWGVLVVAGCAAAGWLAWRYGGIDPLVGVVVGILGAGGVRAAAEAGTSSPKRGDGSDAGVLAETIGGPAGMWAFLMTLMTLAAVAGTVAVIIGWQ